MVGVFAGPIGTGSTFEGCSQVQCCKYPGQQLQLLPQGSRLGLLGELF